MNGAIVIRWTSAIPGREAKGLEVFGEAVGRFEGYAKAGRIAAHREFFSVSGSQGGFMLVEGELGELAKIMVEEDTLRLNDRAGAIVAGFAVDLFGGGDDQSIQSLMGQYTEAVGDLGYMA